MKEIKFILIIWFGLFSQTSLSQIKSDSLVYSKGKYYYQNKIYTNKNVNEIFYTNEKAYHAYSEVENRKSLGNMGMVLSGLSFGAIALVLVIQKRNSEEVKTGLITLTAIPIGVSLFLYGSSEKKIKEAVNLFNEGNQLPSLGVAPMELNIGNTSNGVGVVLNF